MNIYKNLKPLYCLLFLVLCSNLTAMAGTRMLKGVVLDSQKEAVPGATIKIKGAHVGAICDVDGRFALELPSTVVTLEIQAVGMFTAEVIIPPDTMEITIVVKEVSSRLDEVMIMGAVSSRQSYTGSKSTVSTSAIQKKNSKGSTWKRSGLPDNAIRLEIGDNDYLDAKAVEMAVQVDGFRVRVLMDCFFYNDRKDRLEGLFKLKLPPGASPYYFAFGETVYADSTMHNIPYVDYLKQGFHLSPEEIRITAGRKWDRIKEARIVSKQKAARAYEQTVSQRIDPALMEWGGADMFSCRVYPLSKGKLHRIVIGYDLNMTEALHFREYLLQLPAMNKNLRVAVDMAATADLNPEIDPAIPMQQKGGRLQFALQDPREKSWAIRYHNVAPVLLYDTARAYFGASYRIELPEVPQPELPSSAVFLLDVSLSSNPDKFNVWLKLMEEVLERNKDVIKRFAVLTFNIEQEWWMPAFMKNTSGNRNTFMEYAQTLAFEGATDLSSALGEASRPYWLKDSIPKQIFLMTDGDYNWGESNLSALKSVLNKGDKIHTYKTGLPGTNTDVLNALSKTTGGFAFTVTGEEEAVLAAKSLRYRPWVIEDIKVAGVKDFLISGQPTQLYNGQKLILAGRGKPQGDIYLKLDNGEQVRELRLSAQTQLASGLSARIYGQLALSYLQLSDEETPEITEATEAYAQHFRIPGESMSFLMLDSQWDYDRYGIDDSKSENFVRSNTIAGLLESFREDVSGTPLGNGKKEFISWIRHLQQSKEIKLQADSMFMAYVQQLPESVFKLKEKREPLLKLAAQQSEAEQNMLASENIKYDEMLPLAEERIKDYGKMEALKLMSSVIERNPSDYISLRDMALKATDWKLGTQAYHMIRRIISAREQEALSYLIAARALESAGRQEMALIYYHICTHATWDSDYGSIKEIAALYYRRLLLKMLASSAEKKSNAAGSYPGRAKMEIEELLRKKDLLIDEADVVILVSWNRDNTDIDLHVEDPDREECDYSNPETKMGGTLSLDVTSGYGPEMFVLKNAASGAYRSWLEYFNDDDTKTKSKSKAYVEFYKNWGRSDEKLTKKLIVLEKEKERAEIREADEDSPDRKYEDDEFEILTFKVKKKIR